MPGCRQYDCRAILFSCASRIHRTYDCRTDRLDHRRRIANVVYAGLTSDFRFIFAGIFGLLYAPLVMTGLHHMTNAIDTQLIAAAQNTSTPGTILWPMIALSNIAQGSSVLAMCVCSVKMKELSRLMCLHVSHVISGYRTGTFRCQFKIRLSAVLRNDRFSHRRCNFCRLRRPRSKHRCRRSSGNPFHRITVLFNFLNRNDHRHRHSVLSDDDRGQNQIVQS